MTARSPDPLVDIICVMRTANARERFAFELRELTAAHVKTWDDLRQIRELAADGSRRFPHPGNGAQP